MWVVLLKLPPRQRAVPLFPKAQEPELERGVLEGQAPNQDADGNDLEEHGVI